MGNRKKTRVGSFLFERKGKYKPDNRTVAGLRRLEKIDFLGNFHIVQKPSKTNMILIRPGDLVVSGINVSKGAIGIYNGREDITATIHYSSYTFDTKRINVGYFKRFLKSPEFVRLLQAQVKGGIKTEIKPKHILPLAINLPELAEQKEILSHLRSVEAQDQELKSELIHQQTLLKKLRQQILQEAIKGNLTQNSPPLEGCPKGGVVSPPLEGCPKGGVVSPTLEGCQQESVKRHTQNYFSLPFNPNLKQRAKELRKAGNLSEVLLWQQIKNRQFKGLDFDRQKIIGNYIVDFYCANFQIVIEIDGSSHADKQDYDCKRDAYLQGLGLGVIRISDTDIKKNLAGVMQWLSGHGVFQPPRQTSSATPPKEGNFEGVGELLARIRAEKERLIKDGKIKPQKPLPPISEEEKPFVLPEGWVWCRLGDISNYGKSLKIEPKDIKNNTWILELEDIEKTSSKLLRKIKFIERKSKSTKTIFMKDDVLYGKLRPYLDKVIVADQSGVCTTEIVPISLTNSLNPWFIKYSLKTEEFLSYVNYQVSGMRMPRLKTESGRKALIPLPPLPEQKAIVAKVDKLLALCDQLQTRLRQNKIHAEQLMPAVLKQAFLPRPACQAD